MKAITGVILSLAMLSATAQAAGNIDAGKAVAEKLNCASCHGKDFNSPIDPAYPKIAGQHKDYLEHALKAYQRGDGPNGRTNAIMGGQAKALSAADIANISAYLSSLPGSLVVKK
ncbi:c-type cytochrome [Undibacterium curvum]|uniref:c-type cytochrome n=1 Tax=Undibacterium curvum TaxID=2762294 RepID=UPI003D0C9774